MASVSSSFSSPPSSTSTLSKNQKPALTPITPDGSDTEFTTSSNHTLLSLSSYSHPSTSPSSQILTCVHNKIYDITTFVERHPGGDLIMLAAGRDATCLWETYHPRVHKGSSMSKRMDGLMNKLCIGDLVEDLETNVNAAESESFYSWESEFYPVLKQRVTDELKRLDMPLRGGNGEIFVKAFFLLCGFWGSLYMMCTLESLSHQILASSCMGAFASFVGTCIQHDGSHGSFSSSLKLNKAAGWTLDMIGASAFTWEIQHMLGHHPYTNVLDVKGDDFRNDVVGSVGTSEGKLEDQESDPDVFSSFPLIRMHPHHPLEGYHKYQHLYAPFLFAFMTLSKVFGQDLQLVREKKLYHIDATCRYNSILNVLRFWLMKALSCFYMVLLPIYFTGLARGVLLFTVGHLVCGEMLATMFIVNHVIEGVAFGEKNNGVSEGDVKKPKTTAGITPMELLQASSSSSSSPSSSSSSNNTNTDKSVPLNNWAAVQCQTSVNWSSGSWFWNHFSGGLSHQIEHHLFPSICHTNYVYIHPIVKETCREYGVPYTNEPSLYTAYFKMIRHLKGLGCGEDLKID